MKDKIEITHEQALQFNQMVDTLRRITKYQTPDQLRESSEGEYGLDFEEAIEMAYDNIQQEARDSVKNIKHIRLDGNIA